MSGITSHNASNLNDIRAYPFTDNSSRRDDNGNVLPEYVLNDCHLWWPDEYGTVGAVSSVTLSPSLLSVAFVAHDPDNDVSTLIATLIIDRPGTPYKSVEVKPLKSGVGGWASAGNIPQAPSGVRTWHFSDVSNSTLLPRLAQAYTPYPVTSLGKDGLARALRGQVKLIAGSNLEIVEGYRYIDGKYTRCVVFGLDSDQLPSLYDYFAGPCGKRPESRNCDRAILRTINGVGPDGDGVLTVEVNDDNNVIRGVIEEFDGTNVGIELVTAIDYDDVCSRIDAVDVFPDDLCESSAISHEYGSSSSAAPISSSSAEIVRSSSSTTINQIEWHFDSVDELNEFSLFEKDDKHVIDWQRSPGLSPFSGEEPNELEITLEDSFIKIPFRRVQSASTTKPFDRLRNNFRTMKISNVGDYMEMGVSFSFRRDEIENLFYNPGTPGPYYDDYRIVYLTLEDENLNKNAYTTGKGLRVKLQFERQDDGAHGYPLLLTATLQKFASGSWNDVTAYWIYKLGTYGSSSVGTNTTPESIDFDVIWSITHNETTLDWDLEVLGDLHPEGLMLPPLDEYSEPIGGSTIHEDVCFFGLDLDVECIYPGAEPLASVTCAIDRMYIRGTDIGVQKCLDEDFRSDSSVVPYRLKYAPDGGWSNDFATDRALNQFLFKPTSSLLLEPQQLELVNNVVTYPEQYLSYPSANPSHNYGVLTCDNSSLSTEASGYIFSLAIQLNSADDNAGIMLGWQNQAKDPFWAMVLSGDGTKYGYGMHYNHKFYPNGWEPMALDKRGTWGSWYRLIVWMRSYLDNGNTKYSAAMLLRNEDDAVNSSSSTGTTKVISVDQASPTYAITGITEWGSGVDSDEFSDGSPGVYVFGGRPKIAEFTVSPAGQDIVIPNKCPWLPV